MSEADVRELLRKAVTGRYGAYRLRRWCADHGFSRAFVYMVLSGRKEPSERMCSLLGVRKITHQTTYEPISKEIAA